MYQILKESDVSGGLIQLKNMMQDEYELAGFAFTNNLHNVTSNNNILPYYENTTQYQLELTQQYCNGDDLATDIASKINAVTSGTATATYNSNTAKFTITNTVNFQLNFGNSISNTCKKLIGFSASNTTSGTSTTSDSVADLTPFKHIKIRIDNSDCNNVNDQSYNSDSFIIQGKSNFGDAFIYNGKEFDIVPQKISLKPTKTIGISFSDHNNNSITLTDWVLILFQHRQ